MGSIAALAREQMTKQRDLKRLVRDRQSQTGESYMVALRHVRGPRGTSVPVVEFVEVTDIGAAIGLKCRVLVLPELAERVDVTAVLQQLRAVLIATAHDHAFSLMRSVVLCGERPFASQTTVEEGQRFRDRTRAGIGGICDSGRMLSFAVAGRRAAELVVFLLWLIPVRHIDAAPSLLVTPVGFSLGDPEGGWDLLPLRYPGEVP
jgi:hypothetical protein